jgi:hypothetical protein
MGAASGGALDFIPYRGCSKTAYLYLGVRPSIKAKVWDSSKGRIFRIKTLLLCAAARVAVCKATMTR